MKSMEKANRQLCRHSDVEPDRRETCNFRRSYLSCCLAAIIGSSMPLTARATPQGGEVVGGQGSIAQTGATTLVQQQTSSMAVEWQSFNVDVQETVQFVQPTSSSVVLNRILDQNPSQIFGSIQANGRVFLSNPNGLVFGESATINAGSFLASGLDISVDDFMQGRYNFGTVGAEGGAIINRGLITAASGGSVTLIGGSVLNQGVIAADYGVVNMGAGRTAVVDFDGDGLIRFEVDGEVLSNALGMTAAVDNQGQISVLGGQVLLTASAAQDVFTRVVNNAGVIEAGRIDNMGGVVRLVGIGQGEVINSGTIDVTGQDAASIGGTVHLLGENVGLFESAVVDASGPAGGGTVLVGGDREGSNPDIHNATAIYVSKDAVVRSDALINGDGGSVIVYADDTARIYGAISALGGIEGGDGGFVETSGKHYLEITGVPDISAPIGAGGEWLIDPYDLTITTGTTSETVTYNADPSFESSDGHTTLGVGDIYAALDKGNVILQTGGDSGNILWQTGADLDYDKLGTTQSTLTLRADGDITLNADIDDSAVGSDVVNLAMYAGGKISITSLIDTQAGTLIAVSGAGFDNSTSGAITTKGGDVTIKSGSGVDPDFIPSGTATLGTINADAATISVIAGSIEGSAGTLTGGTVDLNATSGIGATATVKTDADTLSADSTSGNIALSNSGSVGVTSLTTGSGDINLTITDTAATSDNITLNGAVSGTSVTLSNSYGAILGSGKITGTAVNLTATRDMGTQAANLLTAAGTLNATLTSPSAATSGIYITEDDALTISSVSSEGNVGITVGNALTVTNITSTGDVDLTAGNAISVSNIDSAGDFGLTAGDAATLGNVSSSGNIGITASGAVTATGTVSTTVDGKTVSLQGAGVTLAPGAIVSTTTGTLSVNAGTGTLTLEDFNDGVSPSSSSRLFSTNGDIVITADDIVIQNNVTDTPQVATGGAGEVTVATYSTGVGARAIELGLDTDGAALSLTTSEISEISASSLVIGSGDATAITIGNVDGTIDRTGGALTLISGGSITDGIGDDKKVDLIADSLTINLLGLPSPSVTNVGTSAADALNLSVSTLNVNAAGAVSVTNDKSLELGDIVASHDDGTGTYVYDNVYLAAGLLEDGSMAALGAITQTGTISAANLTTLSSTGTILGGNNHVSAFSATNTGHGPNSNIVLNNDGATLTLTDVVQQATMVDAGDVNGVTITNTGSVTVSNVDATGNVSLSAGGAINDTDTTLTEHIKAASLTITNASGVGSADNALGLSVDTLGVTASGPVYLYNDKSVIVSGIAAATAPLYDDVYLNSAGGITQTGAILAGRLETVSATGTVLNNGSNKVSVFKATNTTSGNIDLTNSIGLLTLEEVRQNAATGDVTIKSSDISVMTVVAARNVTLDASGTIADADNLVDPVRDDTTVDITAAGLTIKGTSSVGNSPTDALNLSVGTLDVAAGGNVFITNDQSLSLGAIAIGGNDMYLASDGAITQTGTITADGLTTVSATGTILNNANQLNLFTASNTTSGAVSLTNSKTLTVAGVNQTGAGDVGITANNGGNIMVSGVIADGASVILNSTGTVTDGSGDDPNVDIMAASLTVNNALSIGSSTTNALDLSVNTLNATSRGAMFVTNSQDLTLGNIAAVNGSNYYDVWLTADGAINQTGGITANWLTTRSTGLTDLSVNGVTNGVKRFSATSTGNGDISLTNSAPGGTLILSSLGTSGAVLVNETTGAINAGPVSITGTPGLTLNAYGGVTLGNVTSSTAWDYDPIDAINWYPARQVSWYTGASTLNLSSLSITTSGTTSDINLPGSLTVANDVVLNSGRHIYFGSYSGSLTYQNSSGTNITVPAFSTTNKFKNLSTTSIGSTYLRGDLTASGEYLNLKTNTSFGIGSLQTLTASNALVTFDVNANKTIGLGGEAGTATGLGLTQAKLNGITAGKLVLKTLGSVNVSGVDVGGADGLSVELWAGDTAKGFSASDVWFKGTANTFSAVAAHASQDIKVDGQLITTDGDLQLSAGRDLILGGTDVVTALRSGGGLILAAGGNGITLNSSVNHTVTTFDTSLNNGVIDLSGIKVNANGGVYECSLSLVSGSGDISLGTIGNLIPLASVTTSTSGTLYLNGDIHTDKRAGMNLGTANRIVLTSGVLLDSSAGDGDVNLAAPIYSVLSNGPFSLTIDAGTGGVSLGRIATDSPIDPNKGPLGRLASLTVDSSYTTANGSITTEGDIDLGGGVVQMMADSTFKSYSGSVIMGDTFNSELYSLTLDAFDNVGVGAVAAKSFDVVGGSAIALNGNITTTEGINLSKAQSVTFTNDVNLTGGNGVVELNGTWSGAGHALTVQATGGAELYGDVSISADSVDFYGQAPAAINGVNGAGSLTITTTNGNAGDVKLFSVGETYAVKKLVVRNDGITTLAGTIVKTSGLEGVTLSKATDASAGTNVKLAADVTIDTTNSNGHVDLSSASVTGPYTMTINAGDGQVDLGGFGTSTLDAINKLVVTSTGATTLGGNIYTQTVDGINLSGATKVLVAGGAAPIVLDTSNSDGKILLNGGTLDGPGGLDIYIDQGSVAFGQVGNTTPLASLAVHGSGPATFTGNLTTSNNIDLSGATNVQLAGNVAFRSLVGDVNLSGGNVTTNGNFSVAGPGTTYLNGAYVSNSGNLDFGQAAHVALLGDVAISTVVGDVWLTGGAVDGSYALTVNGTGNVNLGNMGQTTALQSLSVTSTGQLALMGDALVNGNIAVTGGSILMDASSLAKTNGGNITATATTGNVLLGELDAGYYNPVTINAPAGDILNNRGASDPSVTLLNITASSLTLNAKDRIGVSPTDAITIDVPESITLAFGADTAYIRNIRGAPVSTTGGASVFDVFDVFHTSRVNAGQNTAAGQYKEDRAATVEADALAPESQYLTWLDNTRSPDVPRMIRTAEGWVFTRSNEYVKPTSDEETLKKAKHRKFKKEGFKY